jgi:hypothetical protein
MMKVKKLIKLLKKVDRNKEVFVSYDTFARQCELNDVIEVDDDEANRFKEGSTIWSYVPGIHLAAMYKDTVSYFLGENEKEQPRKVIKGRRVK